MPGFYVTNFTQSLSVNEMDCPRGEGTFIRPTVAHLTDSFDIDGMLWQQYSLDKFAGDKLLTAESDFVITTEGALFNAKELCTKSGEGLALSIWEQYHAKGTDAFAQLIGPFSGVIYDRHGKKITAWTNHTGDSPVFYYYQEGKFCIASQVDWILDTLQRNGCSITFDEQAAYSMLTYAYMYDGRTYAQEIKRLMPGTCLTISLADGQTKLDTYWQLTNDKFDLSHLSEDEIIDQMDERFRAAVALEFEKDREYDYAHTADLSGGFDGRMVNWVARDMGYGPILNLHYSQADSHEEEFTKKLAFQMGNTLLLRPLNDLNFLYDLERIISMNYGLSLYCGITGGESLLRSINFAEYGMEHTGMVGDVVIGSYLSSPHELYKKGIDGAYSIRLLNRLNTKHLECYPNREMQMMYIRGMMGMNSTFMIRRYYTEGTSPFLNPDFLSFCMSIPVELRAGHKLYDKWVLKKYPDAAQVAWTGNNLKITTAHWYRLAKRVRGGLYRRTIGRFRKDIDKRGMNPFDLWWQENASFRSFYQNYYEEHINFPELNDKLKADIQAFWSECQPLEKAQVLTLLASLKFYFHRQQE